MKRTIALLLAVSMVALLAACGQSASSAAASEISSAVSETGSQPEQQQTIRVAGLKGPTTMGMVQLMQEQQQQETPAYQVDMYGAVDEIIPLLSKGELDMAAIPANLAAVLYQKTEGQLQVAAVNTLGVLYVVTKDETVQSVADLAGKTIYSTGKGTTPEYVLNYILSENGIDPQTDVTVEYKSEATEVLATMQAAEQGAIAVLPQPYVTAAQAQVEGLTVALDLTQEWNKVNADSDLITGVLVVRKEFAEQNPQQVQAFLQDYKNSITWVNENTEQAAQLVADYGIVAKAALAQKALPACNLTYLDGSDMKQKLSGYLQVLYEQNPEAVGGSMPGDDFYYGA